MDQDSVDLLEESAFSAHPQFASTLAHGLTVLKCFVGGASTLGNKDIAERTGLTRPTVSRLTFTLMGFGFLRRDRKTNQYALGPGVLSLGYPVLSQLALRHVAASEMLELAQFARGPISVGTRDRLQVVYVETVQGRDTNSTKPDIGSTRPMLRTAIGRALMYAHHPEDRKILSSRLKTAQPEEWEQFSSKLESAFAEIDSMGFCTVIADWRPNLAAVAVPVLAPVNGLTLALNLTVPAYATDRAQLEKSLGPRLVSLVRNAEYKLGLV